MHALSPTQLLVFCLLQAMALSFRLRPALRKLLRGADGWMDFSVAFRTEQGNVDAGITFREGRARASWSAPDPAHCTLIFRDTDRVREMLRVTPNEVLIMMLRSELRTEGNLSYLSLFNHLLATLLRESQKRKAAARREAPKDPLVTPPPPEEAARARQELMARGKERLRGERVDPGVKFLDEPYLSHLSMEDFPRLSRFLEFHFTRKPEICAERAELVTRWHRENGLEEDASGTPWDPRLRQAELFRYLMSQRRPIIGKDDLLAGTTTAKDVGVVLYPDAHGALIWGELNSLPDRELNPYDVDDETARVLHHDVFPYWSERTFRELVRKEQGSPLCQQLDERFAVYFVWKTVGVSHTIPDFPRLLSLGTRGMAAQIQAGLDALDASEEQASATLRAMLITLQGLEVYAANLSQQAREEAREEQDPARRQELERLAESCRRVPAHPPRTLDEAINAIWIVWVGMHMENTNTGLSLGRLDQWLQPFLAADMARAATAQERDAVIRRAVELCGCLYMRCTDHLPLVPDIGNYLFGGASSDQAITLGGVTPDGEDGVNDMTYVLLKVTELLATRDPNVNARFHPEKNSETYLRRVCEVNYITAATPSMHNDQAVFASLKDRGYPDEAVRDWSATGCVEPTLSGQHMGHTGCTMFNMVAAVEMALNNGRHPLMRWEVGPQTGDVAAGAFTDFEAFFGAFATQLDFLAEQATSYNNLLGEAHARLRPTPLLSAFTGGCLESGQDVTAGGARYNSSGVACIGLADVTDSLQAIKALVYDQGKVTLDKLRAAVNDDFQGHEVLQAMVRKKVPLFGSGDAAALQMARRVSGLAHDIFDRRQNTRGGPYRAGFWSMSNHVAFGTLTGALPSGRQAGKAFTPGLTPQPGASLSLLDNLRDVAGLDPRSMPNNIAFNVKVVPRAGEPAAATVDTMTAYAKAYFDLGGMQMQLNVVTSEMLRDAMVNPEQYRNLLVRISGYNAYFVTLNPDMQIELIERSEYGL